MIQLGLYFADVATRGADVLVGPVLVFGNHGYAATEFVGAKSMKGLLAEVRASLARASNVAFGFERTRAPGYSISVFSRQHRIATSGVGTLLDGELAPTAKTFALLTDLAAWGDVLYGFGHDDYELAYVDKALYPHVDGPLELREIFQYNILGKALVDDLGRARVLSAPAEKIVELPKGGVVIDAGASAEQQARVFAHLRPDQRVRVRQVPARVQPNWDAELAPVFATLVERTALEERNAVTARFNALRPAPVAEFATKPYASDVDDPARLTKLFRSVAEDLIVLLHDKEPALGSNAGPEVLPLLDVHFYQEDYPGTFGAEKTARLLRPLGAWLGQLLVRELGGAWVPRMKNDEIAVVVGDVALLPLLRARRYLASREAVLEYSLTKFFADARRLVEAAGR